MVLHCSGNFFSLFVSRVAPDPGVPAAVGAGEEILQPHDGPPGHHSILHRRGDRHLGVEALPFCDYAEWNHVDELPLQGFKVLQGLTSTRVPVCCWSPCSGAQIPTSCVVVCD